MEISVRSALLVTADDALLDQTLAVCAAAGVEPELAADVGAARARWVASAVVMIGADQAHRLTEQELPRRSQLLLLDLADPVPGLAELSRRLRAPVLRLPADAIRLTATLADALGRSTARGRVLAVAGGSGGVGASTLSTALAVVAARAGRRTLLVDLDPFGGGIDLLVGAEREPGWRWPRLLGARGQLGDLRGQLPRLEGMDLVAMSRGVAPARSQIPTPEAMAAVVSSGSRSHELVVLDLGRTASELAPAALRLADSALLLVSADVRGVAAGRETHGWLASSCGDWHLLLRRPRAGGLPAADAADGFEPALLAAIEDDPALALAAQRGTPPARAARSQLARACRTVLSTVVWPEASAA